MRGALTFLLLLLSSLALADFGNASYTRLSPDRLVIFAGSDRYLLSRDAAWSLADETQAAKFTKWREKAELPADLGKLIAGLPKDREVPFLGEVRVADAGEGKRVTFGLTQPTTIDLKAVEGGWRPDDPSKQAYAAMAKTLKVSPSTLSVNLANSGDEMSEEQAWAKFVKRFQGRDFFVVIGNRGGTLWARADSKAPPSTANTNTDKPKPDKPASTKPKTVPQAEIPIWIWIILGASVVGNAVLVAMIARKQPPKEAFTVSHHERQLVEKVRDEQRRLNVDAQSRAGAEELVVGKMMEAYDQYDKVNKERLELMNYKQFKESFDTFDNQAKQIKKQSEERQKQVEELKTQLRKEEAKQSDLQKDLTTAKNRIASLESELKSSDELLDKLGLWQSDFDKRLQEMAGQLRDE